MCVCVCMCVCVLVAQLCLTLCHPWAVAHQAPLSMEFSRQEYWSGLLFPSPRHLPHEGSNPSLLHCRQILYHLSHQEICSLIYLLALYCPVEKEMATHSSTLAWRIPWTEEPDCSPWGCKESDRTEQLTYCPDFLFFTFVK